MTVVKVTFTYEPDEPDETDPHYRWRFTNWLLARPWRWRYRTLYRTFRAEQRNPFTGRLYAPARHPLLAAWLALSFPHVHHHSEEADSDVEH